MSSERPKKPPVLISELNSKKDVKHEKGALEYVEGQKDTGNTVRSSKSKVNLTQLVLAIGLSVLVFFVISNFMLASKKDATTLLDNQRILEGKQNTLQTTVTADSGRIDNIISNYATKSELAGFASASALEVLSERLTGFGGTITSLDTRVAALEEAIEALEVDGNSTDIEGSGSIDYYFSNEKLHLLVSRSGWYIIKFTLLPEDGIYGENVTVWEYYTSSHWLEEGGWVSRSVPDLVLDKIDEDYNAFVEVLVGMPREVDETPEEW